MEYRRSVEEPDLPARITKLLLCCYLAGAVEGDFWKRVKDRVY
jgi:hypothetical protein